MRLSSIPNDPGFAPNAFADLKVLLDGEEVAAPMTANEEDGWVRVGPDEVRRGKVEIVRETRSKAKRPASE